MKAILLSGSYSKIEIPQEVIDFFRENTNNFTISFIAADFDDYVLTDKLVNKLINAFEEKKFVIKSFNIIDNRMNAQEMVDAININEIIFLLGGDTLKQINSLNEYELIKHIKKPDKLIVGISAGAINMAKKVILAKDVDDNIPELSIYDGIGITKINIEPHCDFYNIEYLKDLEEASFEGKLLLMNDNCFIIINEEKETYYGDYCYLENGKYQFNNNIKTFEEFLKVIKND